MKLSLEDIKMITRGAVEISYDGTSYVFNRFTSEQQALYKKNVPERYERIYDTAGIVIDFSTNSSSISFDAFSQTEHFVAGMIPVIDVYEDNSLIYTAHLSTNVTSHTVSLSQGNKRVRMYFDCYAPIRLVCAELDDGADVLPTRLHTRALIYGDSITHGARATHPSMTYANRISAHFGWDSVNQGVGGEIFREFIPGTIPLFDAQIITVAYGTNDWNSVKREKIKENATAFFKSLRALYPSAHIYYISPVWRRDIDKITPAGDFKETAKMLEELAAGFDAEIIHGQSLMPSDEKLFADGLHPTDTGFGVYSNALIKAISKE